MQVEIELTKSKENEEELKQIRKIKLQIKKKSLLAVQDKTSDDETQINSK